MRVIAGQFKGKKILEPRDKTTRPLKNLVKESIFNIIIHSKKISVKINKSNILGGGGGNDFNFRLRHL